METKEQVLQACKVEGKVIKLPDVQLERKLYMDVANSLSLIGGKWKGGKIAGFVFHADPTDLLKQIANGEKRNLKKEFQFFGTPDVVGDDLASRLNLSESDSILEPSAGQGALVKAVNRVLPGKKVDCYELMDVNQTILRKIDTVNFLGDDFLKSPVDKKYDKIIANPPFTKNQDIDHIYAMWERLEEGGILATAASSHWLEVKGRKEVLFSDFVWANGYAEQIPAGAFKESGTNIRTTLIVLSK